MKYVKFARCIDCGAELEALPTLTVCPRCGGLTDIVYDYDAIRAALTAETLAAREEKTIWRYRELLPVEEETAARMEKEGLRVGNSPLYSAPALAAELGIRQLYIKDDGQNPSSSAKDRASAVGVAKALEAGSRVVACASTGNAASSLAANAARAGLESYIFVPERAPRGKIAQLRIFGAHVFCVKGDYAATHRLAQAAIGKYGWFNRNCAVNPYLLEGKKTVSLEIAEQLRYTAPDYVAVSVGDGCTIAGVWKGLKEMHTLGLLDRLPRLIAVQAEGCCPLVKAYKNSSDWVSEEENTLADSIAVGEPGNPKKALDAMRESRAVAVTVTDGEILDAMRLLGRTEGVFGEPAGVAALAGVKKARQTGELPRDCSVVYICTGNGLKDTASGILAAGEPETIEPTLSALTF